MRPLRVFCLNQSRQECKDRSGAKRVFAENLIGLGFFQSVSYINSNNVCCGEKVAQMPFLT